eukprot:TRINITY_DN5195_c0_g1_i5.p1 TRINITY_DN5195_c0_g1~~TRINITY_DN5195_c0_g1_i5.p1  ORF type:complete len:1401 (-),score=294.27 TRINITY_DN5195_c0_g1_i5:106-4308(-)
MKGDEDQGADRVRVAVRVRPLVQHERMKNARECVSYVPQNNQLILGKDRAFTFDHVFSPTTEQESVYYKIGRPLVDGCFEGYNATILAYGQTGAGKTFTMGTNIHAQTSLKEMGIIPRVIHDIFQRVQEKENAEIYIRVAFVELYNEEVRDLLHPTDKSPISIRENEQGDIILAGVREENVKSAEEMRRFLEAGMLRRTTGMTGMNDQSSRSHAIFTISIEQRIKEPRDPQEPDYMFAKLHLVDLAGSERNKRTGAQGVRFKESIQINTGLLALGNVISALSEGKAYVPYRDSKLTRMLQDSLGGNSRTLMIACISPADNSFDETLNTLRYANRAKNIRNKPIINRDPGAAQLTALKNELQSLQIELGKYKELLHPIPHNIDHLLQKTQLKKIISDYLNTNQEELLSGLGASRSSLEGIGVNRAPFKSTQIDEIKGYIAELIELLSVVMAQSRATKTVFIDGNEYIILKLLNPQYMELIELMNDADALLEPNSLEAPGRPSTGEMHEETTPAAFQSQSKKTKAPPSTAPIEVRTQNFVSSDAERPRTMGTIKKMETDPRNLMQLQLNTIKDLEEELSAAKDEIQSLRKQLHTAQQDLRRDEEIFSTKLDELRNTHAQNRSLEQQLMDMKAKIVQLESITIAEAQHTPSKQPKSSQSEVEIQTSQEIRSFSVTPISSHQATPTSVPVAGDSDEDSFPVIEEAIPEKDAEELQRILTEKRRVEEEKVQLEQKLYVQVEQHQQNIKKMESYMRELATNIKMKEELIKELVRNEKEAQQTKVQQEVQIKRLEFELQKVREEYEKLSQMSENESQPTERKGEVQQMKKKYEQRLGSLQAELASAQKQHYESERVHKITAHSDRKIHQLQEELDKLRTQQDQLKRRMKEEYERAQELHAVKTKEINNLRKVIEKDQKRIRDLEKENQSQKLHIKKKSEEAMHAQRKYESQHAELERQKVLLDREIQKHVEQKRAMELLNAELHKRETIIREREQYLMMRNTLEVKKLRSSQAIVEDIHGMTKQIEAVERDLRDKEKTMGVGKGGDADRKQIFSHINQIQSHRDELVHQRSLLQDRLARNQVLQKHEEEELKDLTEKIEDLESEIEYKSQAIREAQKVISTKEDTDIDITTMNREEAKMIMKRYLEKILELTDAYRSEKEKCLEFEYRVAELESYIGDLQNSLQMRDVDYDRQITNIQKEYEHRVQGLLRQIRAQETPEVIIQPEVRSGDSKFEEVNRELYYYKQSYKELKKKAKQMVELAVVEKIQKEKEYLSERNLALETEIKNLKDYLMRHQSTITTVRRSLKELRHVPADQIERKIGAPSTSASRQSSISGHTVSRLLQNEGPKGEENSSKWSDGPRDEAVPLSAASMSRSRQEIDLIPLDPFGDDLDASLVVMSPPNSPGRS